MQDEDGTRARTRLPDLWTNRTPFLLHRLGRDLGPGYLHGGPDTNLDIPNSLFLLNFLRVVGLPGSTEKPLDPTHPTGEPKDVINTSRMTYAARHGLLHPPTFLLFRSGAGAPRHQISVLLPGTLRERAFRSFPRQLSGSSPPSGKETTERRVGALNRTSQNQQFLICNKIMYKV